MDPMAMPRRTNRRARTNWWRWIRAACVGWLGGAAGGGTAAAAAAEMEMEKGPVGLVGRAFRYERTSGEAAKGTVVRGLVLGLGGIETREGRAYQWIRVQAEKADGTRFRTWWLASGYPSVARAEATGQVARYRVQEGDGAVVEYRDGASGGAVLPSLAGWPDLLPRAAELGGAVARFLGHEYRRAATIEESFEVPSPARTVTLRPDLMIGLPSNTRQKDERRRYDGSDYELVRLGREDYREMVAAGLNCVRVDAAQLGWVEELDTYYWGVGAGEVPFPECLYRSAYLGPAIFLDEPGVGTRDHVLRPRLAKEPAFRKSITPEIAWTAFEEHFDQVLRDGAAGVFGRQVAGRVDADPGTMSLRHGNLYTWETMADTAAHQLSRDARVPAAFVFEPPGRLGTRRTVPEWNMSYGCRLPVDDPGSLTSVIHGFLRGAARLTGKEWGTSVYGAVDRADAPVLLTTAYDQGATRFFFWDNYQLACVPFGEALGWTRHLRDHAASHPRRDLARLREAAEVAILVPPGYGLGHVSMGKGLLWGLGELNLERRNAAGVPYRAVMAAFFREIEHCRRMGIGFDLLADVPGVTPRGYREVVRVRADATVEVRTAEGVATLPREGRPVVRPAGGAPGLEVRVEPVRGTGPWHLEARAVVREAASPVFFTPGADPTGVQRNFVVAWELYGPEEEDYRALVGTGDRPRVRWRDARTAEVDLTIRVEKPGRYRLRAATCDVGGGTAVVWRDWVAGGDGDGVAR